MAKSQIGGGEYALMNRRSTRQDLNTQLLNAVEWGDLPRVRRILHAGADVHADDNGALHQASLNGDIEVVKFLLDSGADLHACDNGALRGASRFGHIEVVKLLLDSGADIHTDDDYALRWASGNGHVEVAVLLFNQAPDYFATLIEQDNKLSTDESLLALVNHYRLGPHLQSSTAPRLRRAL